MIVLEKEIFIDLSNVFSLFRVYFPLEKGLAIYSLIYPMILCAKFGWNLKRRFLYFINVFSLFRNYLLLKKGVALYFKKLDFPSHKDAFCEVWLKLAMWYLRRRISLNYDNVFLLFCNHIPLENCTVIYLNKLESLSPKNALCRFCLKLAQWFWRRKLLNFDNVFLLFRD